MDEEEYLPLSWLSQYAYCPRRAALLLNERQWAENVDTAKGRDEHRRAHDRRVERRGDQLKFYEYDVNSERLRIWGKCDRIEARRDERGRRIPAADFPVRLYPVEYKADGEAIYLDDRDRRTLLTSWQKRKNEVILHPFLKEKIPIGLIPYAQAMLFARVLRGDLDRYPPFVWR